MANVNRLTQDILAPNNLLPLTRNQKGKLVVEFIEAYEDIPAGARGIVQASRPRDNTSLLFLPHDLDPDTTYENVTVRVVPRDVYKPVGRTLYIPNRKRPT